MDCCCGHDHGNDHEHHHGHHHHHHYDHPEITELPDPEVLARDLANWRENQLRELLNTGKSAVTEERPLTEVLPDLSAAMQAFDPRVESVFFPGLSRRELASDWQNAPHALPDSVVQLYEWHNGVDDDAEELFRGYKFLPFADALGVWKALAEDQSDAFLPIMQNLFGFSVLVDLRAGDTAGFIYETDANNYCHPRIYPSLSAYFAAMRACFREEAFAIQDDELVGRHKKMEAIFSRYILRSEQESACQSCADITAALAPAGAGDSELDYRVTL